MKTTLLFCLMACYALASQAQDLTKEETVNYINKKLKEVLEKYVVSNYITLNQLDYLQDGYLRYVGKLETSVTGCSSYNSTPYSGKRSEVTFKATYITKVDTVACRVKGIGILKINFLPNTAKWKVTEYTKSVQPIYKREYWYTDFWGNAKYTNAYKGDKVNCNSTSKSIVSNRVYVYFLNADPGNYSRLMKAFKHLIALYKAEDDPFGE